MRLTVQRVSKASVKRKSDQKVVGKIDIGLFVLLGVKKGDSQEDVNFLAEKLSKLRIMPDGNGKMNLSIKDSGGKILVVSQFTLHGDMEGGNRPSFIKAEEPINARKLYELFVDKLRQKGILVETGSFGEYMEIDAILDGPVTILYLD